MPNTDQANPDEAVLVASYVVRAGREDDFRAWTDRLDRAIAGHAAHEGSLRLEQTGGIFHVTHRFADRAALDAWQVSPECAALREEVAPYTTPRRTVADGDAPWVKLPSDGDAAKWKRFLVTWVAVLPIVLSVNGLLEALPTKLPWPVHTALASFILVAAMTWIVLPRVSRWAKPWVMEEDGRARNG